MTLLDRRASSASLSHKEKRATKRSGVDVKGKIFVPGRPDGEDCLVCDLSPDGAGLKSSCFVSIGLQVVLYIDGFGRYDASVVQRNKLKIGVRFECSSTKRIRIAEQIANYVEHGTPSSTTLRRSARVQGLPPLHCFRLKSGQVEECEVVDIELSGVSLKTVARPTIGEQVFIGQTVGIVLRHTETGIVVQFVGPHCPTTPDH